jgi:hypothetical protein
MDAASQSEDNEEARGLLRLAVRYARIAAAEEDGTARLIVRGGDEASSPDLDP